MKKLLLIFTILMSFSMVCAQTPDRVKAAYIYNFIKLTTWSDNPGGDIDLCYTGENPDMYIALQTLDGKKAGIGYIRFSSSGSGVDTGCEVVFSASVSKLQAELPRPGLLTISDDPSLLINGGIIELYAEGNRVRFNVSLKNAQSSGLKISSKLLQHAAKVYKE